MADAREPGQKLPKLIRFVLVNAAIGMLIGWGIAMAVLWFDLGGFGTMMARSGNMLVALFVLFISFGSTFAFAYLATAVWLLPTDKDDFDRVR